MDVQPPGRGRMTTGWGASWFRFFSRNPLFQEYGTCFLVRFCFSCFLLSYIVSPFVSCWFFRGVISCKTHKMKLKYLRRRLKDPQNRYKMVVLRGILLKWTKISEKSMPRNVIMLGSQRGLHRFRSTLQNRHLCFLQIYFHQPIFSWFNAPKQPNSPTFPDPHQKKHVVIHFHQGHPHESNMSLMYVFPTHQKNIQAQWGWDHVGRHMVPTPMGLSLLAAFEELDPQWLVGWCCRWVIYIYIYTFILSAFLNRQWYTKHRVMLWNVSWIEAHVITRLRHAIWCTATGITCNYIIVKYC